MNLHALTLLYGLRFGWLAHCPKPFSQTLGAQVPLTRCPRTLVTTLGPQPISDTLCHHSVSRKSVLEVLVDASHQTFAEARQRAECGSPL